MDNTVGFIGLGRMGVAICERLIASGVDLHVFNRTREKASSLLAKGAIWAADVPSLARAARVIFICTTGSDATNVFFHAPDQGLLSCLNVGSVVVDLSTIAPEQAIDLHACFRERGLFYVECPVSGGIEGVMENKLSAILSGDEWSFEQVKPFLDLFCLSITYVADPGKAQSLKILNNLAESINLAGALEVINLGRLRGLDLESMAKVFKNCRGRSAYMDVALKYVLSGEQSSDVSLTVRCKDLDLVTASGFEPKKYLFSALAISSFHEVKDLFGGAADQCSYYSFLSSEA